MTSSTKPNTVKISHHINVEIPDEVEALEAINFLKELKAALRSRGWQGNIRSRLVVGGVDETEDRHNEN